ncbi:Fungal transcriptional regulatory protein [Metarhizium guizhouense ARSEF 977]|uniref:Fungal transcriptional regulatory protein n=1 Tax=Metarhizium guizhouense (strain ARSEF 977) TaxID=1276136 RepID=A0A0B4GTA5_METGA|nr:Fungal transcriptional regulatory protein [Metarhizium guizhouense ARSEF 977]
MGRQPRQRPISCTLCRVRKLRCSRVFPCSNCTSRGVVCQHEGTPQDATVASQSKSDTLPKDLSASELLSRLERLEALVASQAKTQAQTQTWPPGTGSPISADTRKAGYPESGPPTSLAAVPSRLQRLTADALWLERSCSGQKLLDSVVADPITFRTCPIRLITKPSGFIFEPEAAPGAFGVTQAIRCIWLPRREEAHILLQKYLSDVSHFHHIIHAPSMGGLIDATYNGLEQGDRVDIGAILLLLSICTTTTYAWTTFDDSRCLFANYVEANSQATSWLKASLDVADHAHRTAHLSVECVQGMIVMFYVLCSLEGVSSRARSLVAKSIAMGRELALHRIDYSSNGSSGEVAGADTVKTEISRRVWWYLTATDWMLAQFSVPQEGTYTIHPNHMAVRKPRNVDDEELISGRDVPDHAAEKPTCVSYFLQRIRLAEVCHGLLDRSPFILLSPETLDYRQVMEVDAKFKQFISEMPSFFSLGNTSLKDLPLDDPRCSPNITVQRYTLNLLLHRQLCKLHLPYLARGAVETPFAYSQEMCMKSARIIIQVEHQLRKENLVYVSFRQRMNMVLRSVFIATIALVLSACLGGDGDNGTASGEEVADAWRILEEARHQSPVASKLLELSVQVLKKHRGNHPALEAVNNHAAGKGRPPGGSPPMTPDSGHRDDGTNGMLPPQTTPESETAYLEQQWQALQGRMDLDAIDWDRLFWGLDAPFI